MGRRKTVDYGVWEVVEEPPGLRKGIEHRVTLVDLEPSEKDGSDKVWRGKSELLRQRKAVELDNPRAMAALLNQNPQS